jgi:hypothetical protein
MSIFTALNLRDGQRPDELWCGLKLRPYAAGNRRARRART